jgi:hypothetical protein
LLGPFAGVAPVLREPGNTNHVLALSPPLGPGPTTTRTPPGSSCDAAETDGDRGASLRSTPLGPRAA